MRALEPVEGNFVERDGARLGYEIFGEGDVSVLLMPTFPIVHSRIWKMQVPYLARHYRVVVFDGIGNGAADRSSDPVRYSGEAGMADAIAVLDATGTNRAIAFTSSGGTHRTLLLAAQHPDRVDGAVFIGPATPFGPTPGHVFLPLLTGDQGEFLRRFMDAAFREPHSTKPIEDAIAWGNETTIETLQLAALGLSVDAEEYRRLCADVTCPVLVVQGTSDDITPEEHGRGLVEAIGDNASLVLVEGGGHRPDVRDPIRFSLLTQEFIESIHPRRLPRERRWTRAAARRRKVLFLSSAIGLGHARRDIAIARELRHAIPDVDIQWLAQDPVTRALSAAGEQVHPASAALANEVAHLEAETAGHDLHCFQAWRGLDETHAANFTVFHELVSSDPFDLVIGDEAWDVDYFLHENPELKRHAYVWLTDFVGWLPMPDGGANEARLTADYNAEMVEQIARYPRIRDLALFVGNPDDVVPDPLGPDLPDIRGWTEAHFDFPGYISGHEVVSDQERAELRARLGYGDDDVVCIVSAGGSSAGTALLRQVVAAYPYGEKRIPGLRMVVVAGPRIDLGALEAREGVEVHGYLPDLDRHLAACDIAIVQGGLTTAMELTATRRPFLYFPLAHHFEQQRHVPHRLDRYRAGRRMELADTDAEGIAEALTEELARPVKYRPVEVDGARRAAAMIASLL